jgi:hypothetical protein
LAKMLLQKFCILGAKFGTKKCISSHVIKLRKSKKKNSQEIFFTAFKLFAY